MTLERRDAAFRPGTFNDANYTVEVVFATDTPVQRQGYVEILDVAGMNRKNKVGA